MSTVELYCQTKTFLERSTSFCFRCVFYTRLITMIPRPVLNRVPGELPALKSDHYIQDLTKLHYTQLVEIREREEKLMRRIPNLNKLPDKGQRIKDFYQKVLKEIERRCDVDEAVEKFSEMNIVSAGKEKLIKMEWNANMNENAAEDVIDSDDEAEMDPLKIIAQRSMHEKKIIHIAPEETLITQKDIEEINAFNDEKTESIVDAEIVTIDVAEKITKLKPILKEVILKSDSDMENAHLNYLVQKGVDLSPTKEKFKPYQTTISNVHDPEKEKARKQGMNWENSAATPPLIQHGAAILLPLNDSVMIQKDYLAKLKNLQEKQAAERLAAKIHRITKIPINAPSAAACQDNPIFNTYREPNVQEVNIEGVQQIDEDDEVEDLDDVKSGGVVYTVFE